MMADILPPASTLLTRETYRNLSYGWKLSTEQAANALGTIDDPAVDVEKAEAVVRAAAKHLVDDGFISGPAELDDFFDRLQGLEPPDVDVLADDGNNLPLMKGGAQLQVYQILKALNMAWEPDVEGVAPVLGGQAQKISNAILGAVPAELHRYAKVSVPRLLSECQACGIQMKEQIAYLMATVQRESKFGLWMVELSSGRQYQGRTDLGNTKPGDGVRFKGRGFVQCTGRKNYTYWAHRLGVDLVGKPALAAQAEIAAKIATQGMRDGTFTGKKLADYFSPGHVDYLHARKIINGMDHAEEIAGFAKKFFAAIAAA